MDTGACTGMVFWPFLCDIVLWLAGRRHAAFPEAGGFALLRAHGDHQVCQQARRGLPVTTRVGSRYLSAHFLSDHWKLYTFQSQALNSWHCMWQSVPARPAVRFALRGSFTLFSGTKSGSVPLSFDGNRFQGPGLSPDEACCQFGCLTGFQSKFGHRTPDTNGYGAGFDVSAFRVSSLCAQVGKCTKICKHEAAITTAFFCLAPDVMHSISESLCPTGPI